jgi:hypothetical protein
MCFLFYFNDKISFILIVRYSYYISVIIDYWLNNYKHSTQRYKTSVTVSRVNDSTPINDVFNLEHHSLSNRHILMNWIESFEAIVIILVIRVEFNNQCIALVIYYSGWFLTKPEIKQQRTLSILHLVCEI